LSCRGPTESLRGASLLARGRTTRVHTPVATGRVVEPDVGHERPDIGTGVVHGHRLATLGAAQFADAVRCTADRNAVVDRVRIDVGWDHAPRNRTFLEFDVHAMTMEFWMNVCTVIKTRNKDAQRRFGDLPV